MGIWDRIASQTAAGARYPRLAPGTYEVVIERIEATSGQGASSGDGVACEFTIAQSNHPEHPVGEKRAWWQGLKYESNLGHFISLVGSAWGQNLEDKTLPGMVAQYRDQILGEQNICRGLRVRVTVFYSSKAPKPGKEPWIEHVWSKATGEPLPPYTPKAAPPAPSAPSAQPAPAAPPAPSAQPAPAAPPWTPPAPPGYGPPAPAAPPWTPPGAVPSHGAPSGAPPWAQAHAPIAGAPPGMVPVQGPNGQWSWGPPS